MKTLGVFLFFVSIQSIASGKYTLTYKESDVKSQAVESLVVSTTYKCEKTRLEFDTVWTGKYFYTCKDKEILQALDDKINKGNYRVMVRRVALSGDAKNLLNPPNPLFYHHQDYSNGRRGKEADPDVKIFEAELKYFYIPN